MGKNHGKHGTKTSVAKMDSLMRKAENYAYKMKQENKRGASKKKNK